MFMAKSPQKLFRQKAYGFNGLADSLRHPFVLNSYFITKFDLRCNLSIHISENEMLIDAQSQKIGFSFPGVRCENKPSS